VIQGLRIYKKEIAEDLRRRGNSLSTIERAVHVPKSTLSFWLKKVKIDKNEKENLNKIRSDVAKNNSIKRSDRIKQEILNIQNKSADEIKNINIRELWLMGIMLYWRERYIGKNDSDIYRGVRFTSTDSSLIKFFLKWLKEVGHIRNDELKYDIIVSGRQKESINKIIEKWKKLLNIKNINHIYFQKSKKSGLKRKKSNIKRSEDGMLRVRVESSSMLARQITGWIEGVKRLI